MTTLEKIKQSYFADFGAVGSMPWGIINDEYINSREEYQEAMKLVAEKKLKRVGPANPKDYKNAAWLSKSGDLYKAV